MFRKLYCYGLLGLMATGCLAETPKSPTTSPTTAPVEVTVQIDNFTFTPANVTIAPGTKVTWINHDDVPHTATSTTKVFASPALDTDEKFSFVFKESGTFPYLLR